MASELPAVIESPKATTVRTGRLVSTSSPVMIWLSTSGVGLFSLGARTALPGATQVVPDSGIDTVENGVD